MPVMQQTKIRMTAPVMQQTKIPMTAPVMQANTADSQEWQVQFVMPDNMTLDTLPKPLNDQVTLHQVPQRTLAVLKFSGRATQVQLDEHTAKLKHYVAEQGWQIKQGPVFAFYDVCGSYR